MIKTTFKYSKDNDVHRVKETLKDLVWFRNNHYTPILPAGFVLDMDPTTATDEEINTAVAREYKEADYLEAIKYINEWDNNGIWDRIEIISDKIVGANKFTSLLIYLTRYGTGASYWMPYRIITRITNIKVEFLGKTIVHENVHLMIEDMIKEYKLTHWEKEHMVDLILDTEFNHKFKMQPVEIDTTKIDKLFRDLYPDVPQIL